MHAPVRSRTAGAVLVDQLIANGVRHVFCVPGESYLDVLDAFVDRDIEVTVCRQEGGAAMMAEAVGKATGRPGVCFVTRGPGAMNAAIGVHIAQQDSTPMIMFVGQVERGVRDRDAFQEIDCRAVFGSMTKWTGEIDRAERIPEMVARAFHVAMAGRPGPVVLALPEDMLGERLVVADAPRIESVETSPGPAEMAKLESMLASAKRPFVIIGGSRWSQAASDALGHFAHNFSTPVATTFRRSHLFDPTHPCFAGDLGIGPNPKLVAAIRESDLVVLVGGRLNELSSQGYSVLDVPVPQMPFVHVHPGAEELGRVYQPTLAIHATPTAFANALNGLPPPSHRRDDARVRAIHETFLAWTSEPTPQPGAVNLGEVIVWLRENLPADALICNGAGNYAAWIHRFYRFRRYGTQVGTTCASMGYGIPAAVAMKRIFPNRTVVSINGDGDFLMNGQEFATAVQYGLPIVAIVADNAMYGTIRMHQERTFPGRVSATMLKSPDFSDYARAFGGFGVTVEKTADFPAAFASAQASGKPAIIHLKIDAEAITPTTTLSRIREQALARA